MEVGWFFGVVRFFLGGRRAVRGFFLMGGDFKSLCARGICVRPVCPFPYGHDSEHSHSIQTILLVFKFMAENVDEDDVYGRICVWEDLCLGRHSQVLSPILKKDRIF